MVNDFFRSPGFSGKAKLGGQGNISRTAGKGWGPPITNISYISYAAAKSLAPDISGPESYSFGNAQNDYD